MQPRPIASNGLICPLFRRDTKNVCHKCAWYTAVRGRDKNTGQEVDEWGCAIAFGPMLQINTASEARATSVEVNKQRNENANLAAMLGTIQVRENRNAIPIGPATPRQLEG